MLELDTTVDRALAGRAGVRTLGQQLDSRLTRLLAAIRQSEHSREASRVARLLTASWRDEPVSVGPKWPSDITDDHTPFEFSLALDSRAEVLRILTEPQDPRQPSLQASWRLAAQIHEELAGKWGADLLSFSQVADLFEPARTDAAMFSIWHSAVLGSAGKTEFKVYLNPAIHGAGHARYLVAEALARFGLEGTWKDLARSALARADLDQVIYFSLDLADGGDARAKVYVAHRHATAEDLAFALSGCPGFVAADTARWCKLLLSSPGPFLGRPPITCFALHRGGLGLHTATLHLPVRSYAPDDFDIARRICSLLPFPQRVSYMRGLTELAERPLESGTGLQTYASVRPSPGRQGVTVYLAPEVYSSEAIAEAAVGSVTMAGEGGMGLLQDRLSDSRESALL